MNQSSKQTNNQTSSITLRNDCNTSYFEQNFSERINKSMSPNEKMSVQLNCSRVGFCWTKVNHLGKKIEIA